MNSVANFFQTALKVCFVILWALIGCKPSVESTDEQREIAPPNVVLVITDDQGYGDLKVNGNPWIETPVMDQLSRSGAKFDRFYVSPVCAPTRASLLTGRYYLRTGTTWVTHRKEVMRSEEVTMAEVFKAAGYATGIFGKWHNGAQYPNDPLGQGFDEFFGFSAGHWNNYFNTALTHNGNTVKTKGYINDVLTDEALKFISKNRNNPFLCYLPYNTPHGPFQLPDTYFEKYKAKGLNDKDASVYGMCENLDDNIGRVLDHLDSLYLTDNTIFVFLTDNGPNGERYNDGMKGWKGHIDEGGVRVPLYIRWPGKIAPETLVTPITAHIDLLPTLVDLCQVQMPSELQLDGRSLKPLLFDTGSDWPERNIYTVKAGRTIGPIGALRNQQYRMVLKQDQVPQLYDMIVDPGQQNDLKDSLPELAEGLRTEFINWFDQVRPTEQTAPAIPVGHSEQPLVELPAPAATLSRGLAFKGKMGWANDWITQWQQSGDSISWQIYVNETAEFDFEMLYTCPEADLGALIEIVSGENSVSKIVTQSHDPDPFPSPDRIPRGEVYEKQWAVLEVGRMRLQSGPQTLLLQAKAISGQQVMELKSLRLRRVN